MARCDTAQCQLILELLLEARLRAVKIYFGSLLWDGFHTLATDLRLLNLSCFVERVLIVVQSWLLLYTSSNWFDGTWIIELIKPWALLLLDVQEWEVLVEFFSTVLLIEAANKVASFKIDGSCIERCIHVISHKIILPLCLYLLV